MPGAATTLIVLIVPVMVALPALGHAQTPTITRGVLGGSLSPNSSSGVLRGALPQGATTGVVRGTLPPGGTAGLLQAPPPGSTVGVFRDPSAAVTPIPALRPFPTTAATGVLSAPAPPGTRLGEPGPDDVVQGLDTQARVYLQDGNYAHGEAMLNQSVAIREEMVGRVSPEVAGALETDAQLMRHYSRDAAAADMETRAEQIRTKLEPPPAPRKPDRF